MTRLPALARLLPLGAVLLLAPAGLAVAGDTTPVDKVCPSGGCLTEAQKRKLEVQPDPTHREVRAREQPATGQAQPEAGNARPRAAQQTGKDDAVTRPATENPH